jgi:hypothetical protein
MSEEKASTTTAEVPAATVLAVPADPTTDAGIDGAAPPRRGG